MSSIIAHSWGPAPGPIRPALLLHGNESMRRVRKQAQQRWGSERSGHCIMVAVWDSIAKKATSRRLYRGLDLSYHRKWWRNVCRTLTHMDYQVDFVALDWEGVGSLNYWWLRRQNRLGEQRWTHQLKSLKGHEAGINRYQQWAHEQLMKELRWAFVEPSKETWPNVLCSNFNAVDWRGTVHDRNGWVKPSGSLAGISSPSLYGETNPSVLERIHGEVVPWLKTPSIELINTLKRKGVERVLVFWPDEQKALDTLGVWAREVL